MMMKMCSLPLQQWKYSKKKKNFFPKIISNIANNIFKGWFFQSFKQIKIWSDVCKVILRDISSQRLTLRRLSGSFAELTNKANQRQHGLNVKHQLMAMLFALLNFSSVGQQFNPKVCWGHLHFSYWSNDLSVSLLIYWLSYSLKHSAHPA